MQLYDSLPGVALLRHNPSSYQAAVMQLAPLGWWPLDEDSGAIASNRIYAQLPGPELVANGDFNSWVSDDPSGWVLMSESAPNRVISERDPDQLAADTPTVGGAANFKSDTPYQPSIRQTVVTHGYTYEFVLDVSAAGQGQIMVYDLVGIIIQGNVSTRTKRHIMLTDWFAMCPYTVPCDVTADRISVRKVGEMDATIKGTTSMSLAGASPMTGSALAFDGATSALAVTDSRLNGLDELTLMMLVKLDNAGEADNGHLMYKADEFTWRVLPSGQIDCTIEYSTTNAQAVSATGAYSTGEWVWLTCRIGADAVPHLFVNGTEVSYATQTTGSGLRTSDTGNLFIGNDDGQLATLDGPVDEVLVFDRALTDGEISTLVQRSDI